MSDLVIQLVQDGGFENLLVGEAYLSDDFSGTNLRRVDPIDQILVCITYDLKVHPIW